MQKKILHIAKCDKFIPPFIEFVNSNFIPTKHEFLLRRGMGVDRLSGADNIYLAKDNKISLVIYYFKIFVKMHFADKVILHSLLDIQVVKLLFFAPWLRKKCHWFIWGGDLYTYKFGNKNWKWKIKEILRRKVIRNVGYLVTYLGGDVDLARNWYDAKGKHHECVMYTSNLLQEHEVKAKANQQDCLNILVGNSASPSNDHLAALTKLLPFKNDNICIYVPLSYGPRKHAQDVINQGEKWFGEKFQPLTKFMPFDEYVSLLSRIDIAIFNHKRQEAMGNTISLIGLGKTVYINRETTQWQFFDEKGIVVGDVDKFNSLGLLNTNSNVDIAREYFSKKNFYSQLVNIFS